MFCAATAWAAPAPKVVLASDWKISVATEGMVGVLTVDPPEMVTVTAEKFSTLPLYNPKTAQYARGAKLAGVRAEECSTRYALDPDSLKVTGLAGTMVYTRGKDYEAELTWGCVGRLEDGAIGQDTPVAVSYVYGTMRLDSVVQTVDKDIVLRKGVPHVATPEPPALAAGETRLANIWLTPRLTQLTDANFFPVLEAAYPEPLKPSPTAAERFCPKTMAKLKAGGTVRVLAWGDSVTAAGYLPDPSKERWQEQFARRLRASYPAATIELITEAWGGRNTDSYRNEPPGSIHNYKEKVLDARPDLIVSEFVNDAGLNEQGVRERYGRILGEFKEIGAEWIILTPHYVRPDWMGLTSEKEIDDDPRPYVKALRKFSDEHGIALADASLRWGRLWRQGIPYSTLFTNNINHPNAFGMGLFADALMALFP